MLLRLCREQQQLKIGSVLYALQAQHRLAQHGLDYRPNRYVYVAKLALQRLAQPIQVKV